LLGFHRGHKNHKMTAATCPNLIRIESLKTNIEIKRRNKSAHLIFRSTGGGGGGGGAGMPHIL